ncbi:hypothetical protein FOCC_FOCC005856 [Frankliniella occidentalis]|nr:hypothetical protein FOCC_FOCC005856 [Frankliniella occidentalis]
MDGIRGEVSNKIRSAIKAKLMELGAYVDDELPDYIMVMVANKRSRQQMEEDLQLFLGDSTSTFTNWLHTVLSKLQQVTVNSTEIKKAIDKKRPSSEDNKKEKRKKLKKEKDKEKSDKDEKTSEKVKTTEKELDDNTSGLKQRPPKERPIKSEPVDLFAKDLSNDQVQINVQPPKSNTITTQEKKSSESKGNEEEDDEDFINIKADVEVDMWGDTEESSGSALKTSNIERKLPAPSSTEVRVPEPGIQEDQTDHAKAAVDKTALNSSVPLKEVVPPKSSSPSKTFTCLFTFTKHRVNPHYENKFHLYLHHKAMVIYEHQDLDTQKNQISSHQYALPHSQSQTADQAFNKSPTKSKKMRDRSRDKRRRKKKSLELAAERVRQPVEIKLDRISTSGGKSVQNRSSQKRRSRSPVRFSALRMDSPSLIRPNTSYSLGANHLGSQTSIKQASKRIFQSHIVSQRSVQEKSEKSRRRSSSTADNHNRRRDHRNSGKHEQQDLRETIRKERQKEREHGRDRDREQRRSRDQNHSRKSQTSAVRPSLSENDENGTDPTLLSVVRVKPRPHVPAAMQANRSLILKAVAEAQKSVSKVVVRSELSNIKVSPKQVKKNVKDRLQLQSQSSSNLARLPSREKLKRMSFTVVGKKAAPSKESLVAENQPIQRKPTKTQFVVTLDGLDPMLLRSFALETEGKDGLSKPQTQVGPGDRSEEDEDEDEETLRKELVKEQQLREELLRQQAAVREQKAVLHPAIAAPIPSSLNPAMKRPVSPSSSVEVRPSKVISAGSKSSSLERCKFWPACKNGDKCEFLHPSTTCKLFPNCKFGERCLYIHPTCRFNSACTRSDCPYTHTGPRATHSSQLTPPVGANHLGSQTSIKQACKFFPNCSNISCPFIHPTVRKMPLFFSANFYKRIKYFLSL